MEPWPADRTNRSRSGHVGLAGLCFRNRGQSAYAIAAAPIGRPGWPELAFWTASAERKRMVLIDTVSREDAGIGLAKARVRRVEVSVPPAKRWPTRCLREVRAAPRRRAAHVVRRPPTRARRAGGIPHPPPSRDFRQGAWVRGVRELRLDG